MKLFGFSLLRNGIHYDYPFRESLRSLGGVCEEIVLALGDSHDGTSQALSQWPGLIVVPTLWDESLRKGGTILSQQTNLALEELRKRHKDGWALYLQADEVLHEADYVLIRKGIEEADELGADVLSFRYLHFWQSYRRIAYESRWYPQEIRALRLDSPIVSYGDAQSFRGWKKRHEIEARVFHYGHVREPGAYARKKKDFHRWWHEDGSLARVLAKGEASDREEKTLIYGGSHPTFINEKVAAEPLTMRPLQKLTVFGSRKLWPEVELPLMPKGFSIAFVDEIGEVDLDTVTISLRRPTFREWCRNPFASWKLNREFVSLGMKSPQARPWSLAAQIRFHLWQRGYDFV